MEILSESQKFCLLALHMVESDLKEIQLGGSQSLLFENQGFSNGVHNSFTDLLSQDRLVEEALRLSELNLISQILQSLTEFEGCNSHNGAQKVDPKILDIN